MSELAALVRAANEGGMSYERMAARARRRKYKVTGAYLHQIAHGKVKRPTSEKIPAIAAALAMTEDQVREAAARAGGVHVAHGIDYETGRLLSTVRELSQTSRARWYRIATAVAQTLADEEQPTDAVTRDPEGRQITVDEHTRRLIDRQHDLNVRSERRRGQRRANG